MNEELEKEFNFLRNFEVEDFENLKLEKIVVCEDLKTKNIIYVYLKIFENNWQKIYLDAGAGFWEDTKTKDFQNLEDNEDDDIYLFKDYLSEFEVRSEVIKRIHCEPNDENCKIIIELKNDKKIILRCINSKIFDSNCELVLV